MQLRVLRADPAGNITLLVTDEVLPSQRTDVATALMQKQELAAEQVGFVVSPKLDLLSAGRLEMMGGEFCGNAARVFGLFLAQSLGMEPRSLAIEISGCDHPIMVHANPVEGTASSQMPLPRDISPMRLVGFDCVRVDFEGISHLVAACPKPNSALIRAAAAIFEPVAEVDAYGVIFLDEKVQHIIPAVTVKATKSLVWEGSCGSGSVATAVAVTRIKPDGEYSYLFSQPSGSISVNLTKKQGAVCYASIGGTVSLGKPVVYDL